MEKSPYTFNKTVDGNIETFQNGTRISTGSASAAKAYGYVVPEPQVQQTTTSLRTEATENGARLDNRLGLITGTNETNKQNIQNNGQVTVTRDQDNGDGTRTVTYSDGTSAKVQATKNADGTESYKEMSETDIVNNDLSTGIEGAKTRNKAKIDYANTTLDSISAQSTTANKALIESIKRTYEARIKLMEDSNKRTLGAKTVAGQRSGRSRYTNETNQDVLSEEETLGLSRIASLEGEMLSLIAQAETARTDKDLEIFNSRMSELDKADKTLQTEIQNLQKTAYDKLKEMRDAEKTASDIEKAEFDMNLDKSERVAPALVSALAGFTTPEEQATFIQEYSKKTGIPVEILLGDIDKASKADVKSKLDLENIRNTITNRDNDSARANERLALDKKKEDFSPTAEQKAKVGVYISKNGSDEDAQKVKDDPDFFYYILGLAEDDEV